MTRKYLLRRPDLLQTAADLARADALAAGSDVEQRRADELRQHAARVALPSQWRTRNKLTSDEWPPLDDIETWRALGQSHALGHTPAVCHPTTDTPAAHAYRAGYFEIGQAYMDHEQHQAPQYQSPVALAAQRHALAEKALGNYLLTGTVADLGPEDRAELLVALAKHVGLDPLERPFGLMQDKGTWVVYARAACSDGLCRTRGLSTAIAGRVEIITVCDHELLMCRAVCTVNETGRSTEAVATLPTLVFTRKESWHKPDPAGAANLYMKVTTKARRRAVLACVGLGGMPDVSELETIDPAGEAWHMTAEPEDPEVEPPASDEAGY